MTAFQAAHTATKAAMLRQKEKHPSAHKSYRELFALCLKGYYEQHKVFLPIVEKPKFLWLRGW